MHSSDYEYVTSSKSVETYKRKSYIDIAQRYSNIIPGLSIGQASKTIHKILVRYCTYNPEFIDRIMKDYPRVSACIHIDIASTGKDVGIHIDRAVTLIRNYDIPIIVDYGLRYEDDCIINYARIMNMKGEYTKSIDMLKGIYNDKRMDFLLENRRALMAIGEYSEATKHIRTRMRRLRGVEKMAEHSALIKCLGYTNPEFALDECWKLLNSSNGPKISRQKISAFNGLGISIDMVDSDSISRYTTLVSKTLRHYTRKKRSAKLLLALGYYVIGEYEEAIMICEDRILKADEPINIPWCIHVIKHLSMCQSRSKFKNKLMNRYAITDNEIAISECLLNEDYENCPDNEIIPVRAMVKSLIKKLPICEFDLPKGFRLMA